MNREPDMPEFESIFEGLCGSWDLTREISTGESFNGKAVFEKISDTAFLLCEEGHLNLLNGTLIPASRNWFWHLSGKCMLEITYDQERLQDYHLLQVERYNLGWSGSASHLCGADAYKGQYQFLADSFEISQSIKGPNKDYSVVGMYVKT